MKKAIPLAILLVVISLAGCLRGGGDGEYLGIGPGVVITDFRSDYPTIDANEIMFLAFDVENRGDMDTETVTAELIRAGAFLVDENASDTIAIGGLERPLGDVYSTYEFLWQIQAPNIAQDRIEEVQARVYFDYETKASGRIHFVPQDMIREQGKEAFLLDSLSTYGPVDIEIVANQPITLRDTDVVTENDASYVHKDVRVTVIVTNVADGRVDSSNVVCAGNTLDCIDYIEIKGYGPGCKQIGNDTLYHKETQVKLIQGEQGRLSHTFSFDVQDWNAATDCTLDVTAVYRYRVDSPVLEIPIIGLQSLY
jgi:hypothetical protein